MNLGTVFNVGDHLQFTIVLKHLLHYYPQWKIGIECMPGCQEIFNDLCPAFQQIHPFYWRNDYPNKKTVSFSRNPSVYVDKPSTKVTRCLLEEFNLEPIPELYRYEIHPSNEATEKTARYIKDELHGQPFGVIHYKGTASKELKDLSDDEARSIVQVMKREGLTPVILDWNDNPIADNKEIFSPSKRHPYLWNGQRYGDAGTIAALIQRADCFFGIDSGPAHLAGATETPSCVFWKGFHPILNFDPAPNVLHVVCDCWEGDCEQGTEALRYWEQTTNYQYYKGELKDQIEGIVSNLLEIVPDDDK